MKRGKIFVRIGVLSLLIMAILVAFSSCLKEEPCSKEIFGPYGDSVEVRVTFSKTGVTKASTTGGSVVGTPEENRLDGITILVFNGSGVLETKFIEDLKSTNTDLPTKQPKWASDSILVVKSIVNPTASKRIYAIANWNKSDSDFGVSYTEAQLKAEITTIENMEDINGAKAYPILMSGSAVANNLALSGYRVSVPLTRQVAKITTKFTISVATQANNPHIEWQTDDLKITVVNVPNKSSIIDGQPALTGVTRLNFSSIPVDDLKPAFGDQPNKDLKWSESVYLYENPIQDATEASKAQATYIVVQLPYLNTTTNTISNDNYYKLLINDTRFPASPYKVLRNTIYTLDIPILGLGLPLGNLTWDDLSIGVGLGELTREEI